MYIIRKSRENIIKQQNNCYVNISTKTEKKKIRIRGKIRDLNLFSGSNKILFDLIFHENWKKR